MLRLFLATAAILASGVGNALFGGEVLKLRITDNFTHVPLDGIEVFLRADQLSYAKAGVLTSGFFSFPLTNSEKQYQFELRGEGYLPFQSGKFRATNGLPLFDVEMDRQFDFEGEIIAPTGLPAAGALYFLCTEPTEVTFRRDRTFFTRSRNPTEAGSKGKFRLSPELTAHSVLVAHDLGYAQMPLAGWTNGGRIQLRPWGRVAGQMRINGAIAKKERIVLNASPTALGKTKMTLLDFTALTDEEGRFAFENVPPVEVILSWQLGRPENLMNSHSLPLVADPIKTSEIVFDLRGRNISGAFRVDSNPATIAATLTSKPHEVPLELWKAGSGLQSTDFRQTFALQTKVDRTFRAVAIPPGEYVLEAHLFDQENARQSYAIVRGTVSIPSGVGDFDLGIVELRRN